MGGFESETTGGRRLSGEDIYGSGTDAQPTQEKVSEDRSQSRRQRKRDRAERKRRKQDRERTQHSGRGREGSENKQNRSKRKNPDRERSTSRRSERESDRSSRERKRSRNQRSRRAETTQRIHEDIEIERTRQRLYRDICTHDKEMYMDERAVRNNIDIVIDLLEEKGDDKES
jgi:hypothetical protein